MSDIQIFHRQSIVLLSEQILMDELQPKSLIILVVITFCAEVFVTVAWHVLLKETSQVFEAFGLVLLEVTTHNDDAPVGKVASSFAILPGSVCSSPNHAHGCPRKSHWHFASRYNCFCSQISHTSRD